jgi:hypothetical protein
MFFDFVAQTSEHLNRSKAAARAKDRRNVIAIKKVRQIACPAGGLTGEIPFALENSLSEFHGKTSGLNGSNSGEQRRAVNASGWRDDTDARPWYKRRRFMHSHGTFPQPTTEGLKQDRRLPVDNTAGPAILLS